MWCKLKYNRNREILIGVCYRTPSEQVYGDKAHQEIRDLIKEVSNREFVLMGDFFLMGDGRVAVDVTALRRLWQHSPVL